MSAVTNCLNRGLDPNSGDFDEFPETVLTAAIKAHQARVVELLLSRGADIEKYGDGLNPLDTAVSCGDVAIGKLLLDHGASVDGRPGDTTPLATAEANGDRAFTELLKKRAPNKSSSTNTIAKWHSLRLRQQNGKRCTASDVGACDESVGIEDIIQRLRSSGSISSHEPSITCSDIVPASI